MDLEGFILIGGRSSRLGTDKAFVEFGGDIFARRTARLIDTSLSHRRVTFVTQSETQFRADQLAALGHPLIADLKPGYGAWSGMHTALAHATSEWTCILACDLPFLSTQLLTLLAGFADDGNDAVVPRQPDDRLQPLCGFYRTKPVLAVVEAIIARENSLPPIATVLDHLRTHIINFDEYQHLSDADKLFLNVNTGADLAAAADVS